MIVFYRNKQCLQQLEPLQNQIMNINLLKLMKEKIKKEKQTTNTLLQQQKNIEEKIIVENVDKPSQPIVESIKIAKNQQSKIETTPQEKMLTQFQEKKLKIQQKLLSLLTLKSMKKQSQGLENASQNIQKPQKKQVVEDSIEVKEKQISAEVSKTKKNQQQENYKNRIIGEQILINKIDEEQQINLIKQKNQCYQNRKSQNSKNLIEVDNIELQQENNEKNIIDQNNAQDQNSIQNEISVSKNESILRSINNSQMEKQNFSAQAQNEVKQIQQKSSIINQQEKNKQDNTTLIPESINSQSVKINSLMQKMKKLKQSKHNIPILPNLEEREQQNINLQEINKQSKLHQQQIQSNKQSLDLIEKQIESVSVQGKKNSMMEKMMKLKEQKLREEEYKKNSINQQKQIENNPLNQQFEQNENLKVSQGEQDDLQEQEQNQNQVYGKNQEQNSSRSISKKQKKNKKIFLKQIQKLSQITRKLKTQVDSRSGNTLSQYQNQNIMNYIKRIELIINRNE